MPKVLPHPPGLAAPALEVLLVLFLLLCPRRMRRRVGRKAPHHL